MPRLQRFLWLSFAFLIIGGSAAVGLVDREEKAPVRGVFYEVTGSATHAAKSKVYLLGSIHVADKSVYPLPKRVEGAFESSPTLAVEADVSGDAAGAAASFMMAGFYKPDDEKRLKTAVTPQCYAEVEAASKEWGLPMEKLDMMKPWMAAIMFEGFEAAKAGLNPKLGIDMHFLTKAHGKKTIVELEGLQEQVDLFNNLPADQQTALLYYTAKERGKFKTELDRLFKAWRAGDSAAVDAIVQEGEKESPELKPAMDALLGKRNKTMTEKIAAFLETPGDHFVVVGAAHIVGTDGIASQLKGRGFTVEQP